MEANQSCECVAFVCFQDSEGRAPIHAAISNQHNVIIQLLISHPEIRLNLRDRQGMTPFACAMTHKNNKAAEAILKREPGAAEQVAGGGDARERHGKPHHLNVSAY